MKSAILFYRFDNVPPNQVIFVEDAEGGLVNDSVFIRAVVFHGDVDAALDAYKEFIREGEKLLNTIPLSD